MDVVETVEGDGSFGVVGGEDIVGFGPHSIDSIEHRLPEKLVKTVDSILSVTEMAILVGGTRRVGKDFGSGCCAETKLNGLKEIDYTLVGG